ncbi:MAG: PorV/PorQ family protein [Candidatus Zixiibacteriota bacterium]
MTVCRIVTAYMCLVTALSSGSFAQDGLALMKVESGARQAGMGGAAVSVPGEPNATFYNPAAAVGTEKFTFSFGHNTYWENIRLETGYFMANLTKRTAVHGGIRYAAVDDIESRLIPSSEPDAIFSAYDISFKGGLSYEIDDRLALGAALGWFIEKIDIYRGSAFNIDLGGLYRASDQLYVGASVTNLGSALALTASGQHGTDDITLPTTYRVGGSYRFDRYLGALDVVYADDETHLVLGARAELHEMFAVRAGYMVNYDTKDFTAGASFRRRNVTVDYAFVPHSGELGTSHMINLTFTL